MFISWPTLHSLAWLRRLVFLCVPVLGQSGQMAASCTLSQIHPANGYFVCWCKFTLWLKRCLHCPRKNMGFQFKTKWRWAVIYTMGDICQWCLHCPRKECIFSTRYWEYFETWDFWRWFCLCFLVDRFRVHVVRTFIHSLVHLLVCSTIHSFIH